MKKFALLMLLAVALAGCSKEKHDDPPIVQPRDNTGDLVVSWSNKALGVDGEDKAGSPVNVYVFVNPGAHSDRFDYSQGEGAFRDIAARNYSVRVEVYDGGGSKTHEGSTSSVTVLAGRTTTADISLEALAPDTPTGVAVSRNFNDAVKVTWSASEGATSYKIYRSTSSGGNGPLVGSTSQTYFIDSDVDQARKYYYRVAASNVGGDSSRSGSVLGYRRGWRFDDDDCGIYNPANGIGVEVDLYAYGYQGITRAAAVFAVYRSGSSYFYVPGSGSFSKAAYVFQLTPCCEMTLYNDFRAWVYDSTFSPAWRNNNFPQYVAMRVYKSSSISSLNSPYYDETLLFRFYWTQGANGVAVPRLADEPPIVLNEALDILEPEGSLMLALPPVAEGGESGESMGDAEEVDDD